LGVIIILSTSAARKRLDFKLFKKQGGRKSDATDWEYIDERQQPSENAAVILIEEMTELKVENH
jgi:hypothetical protein